MRFYCQRIEKNASKTLRRMLLRRFNCRMIGVMNGVSYVERNLGLYHIPLEAWKSYYKFGFVRNPYKRLVSYYFHLNKNIPNFKPTKEGFLKFARSFNPKGKRKYILQYDYFVGLNGKINFDFIGKLENFDEDIKQIEKVINFKWKKLPYKNKTSYPTDYRNYYNDESYKLVTKKFKKDIEYFNYKFE
jgi:hypothetical protein